MGEIEPIALVVYKPEGFLRDVILGKGEFVYKVVVGGKDVESACISVSICKTVKGEYVGRKEVYGEEKED